MKKNYMRLIVALLFATNLTAQNVPNYVPTNGLVGWWPFNGNTNDESGNGNTLTNNNGSYIADRYGIKNSSIALTGSNSNLIKSNINPSFSNSNQTISYWFKLPSQFNYSTLTLINNGDQYSNGFSMFIDQNDGAYGSNNYIVGYMISNGQAITFNTNQNELENWNNLISTYDGNILKIYLNNKLKASLNFNGIINSPNNDIVISNWSNTSLPTNTNREIDDIGIWNRALTQEEIAALYSAKTCTNPNASITPQSTTTFCQGGSVNLNASTGANYTYEWYNNGNIINGATSSIYNASTSGNYTVKVIDGACNTTSNATTVTVNPYPSSSVQSSGNTTFCQGNNITLTALGIGSYLWNTGATSKTITVNQTGDYTVKITSNGCSSTSTNTAITVNPLPTATIIPQGNTIFCQGGFVNLVANGGTSYQWNTGSSATSISVNQSGTFTVNAFNSFGCQASANQTVTVNANPSVSLNSLNAYTLKTSSPIQLVGNPTGGSYGGEGVTASTFNPATLKLGKKTITYNYTSPQGCSGSASTTTIIADTVGNVCSVTKYDTVKVVNTITKYDTITSKITINDTVGILKLKFKLTTGMQANQLASMTLYPNPTTNILHIQVGDVKALEGYRYRILDALGKVVYNELVKSAITEIPLMSLGAVGMYQFEVLDQKNTTIQTNKIVLQ